MGQQIGPIPTIISEFRRAAIVMIDDLLGRLDAAGFGGLSRSHQAVLENLDPGGTRLTELATRAGITQQSMSELVAVLEQRGYLERRVDPSDGRARLVCLTPAGVQMARRALREITAIEAEWREHLARNGVQGDLVAGISNALADRATRSAGETVDLRSSNRASARRPGEGRPEIAQ